MNTVDLSVFHHHLRQCKAGKAAGQEAIKACCPFHDDHTPSFVVFANGGYSCAGCDAQGHVNQLCDHLGIPRIVANEAVEAASMGRSQWLEKTYYYKDARGRDFGHIDVFRCLDGSKKPFPKLHNAEVYSTGGVAWPLYRTDELAKSKLDVVWFFEGEKCVDAAVGLGLLAVTNQGGSKSFPKTCKDSLSHLNGRTVVIVPDNDDCGETLAEQVYNECRRRGCSASIVRLPGLVNEGDDIVEWLALGNTVDDLIALADGKITASRVEAAFVRHCRACADAVEKGGSLEDSRRSLMASVASLGSVAPAHSMTASEAFEELAKRIDNGQQDSGWWWGIESIDAMAGRIRKRKVIALAGDSGSGKSAFILQAADNVACKGAAVRVYSQEMEAVENVERIAARLLRKPVDSLTAEEARQFAQIYLRIPMTIYERRVDLDFLVSDIRLWAATEENPGMVVVDFVQLMNRRSRQNESEMVHEVAYAMKDLAKELDIAIALLGQLTLEARRNGGKLTKADVRGGGSLCDASDQFLLLEADEDDNEGQRLVTVRLDKFRGGAKGERRLIFDGPRFEFRDRNTSKLLDARDKDSYSEWAEGFEYIDA